MLSCGNLDSVSIGVNVMRKIEQDMVRAIENKKDMHMNNTRVVYQEELETTMRACMEYAKVFLHGNHIGTYLYRDKKFHVNRATLLAYPTRTTMSRLRALGVSVGTRKGKVVLEGETL